MIDALYDFVVLIKDFVISLVRGTSVLVQSLSFLVQNINLASVWMPSYVFLIMSVCVLLIVVLRVIGR